MRTALPWPAAIAAALLTMTPAAGAASEDTTPPTPAGAAKPAAQTTSPAAKPAAAAASPAAKPAGTTPAQAAKPAAPATPSPAAKPAGTAPANLAAKPATATPATPAAKPATATPSGTAAKPAGVATPAQTTTAAKPPATTTPPAAAKPATPAAPGAATAAGTPSAPSTPVDPAQAHLTIAQATFGLRGIGAVIATIEIMREGKPVQSLHCELFGDKAPLAVANFIALGRGLRQWKDPKSGQWVKKPLYDGNLLHRVVPEMLVQGGDPNCTGDPSCRGMPGFGDPGYTIADEVRPELRFDRPGRLAMSNRGPGTSGSQFFITEREAAWLNGGHTIFGQCDGAELIAELSHVEAGSRDVPKAPLVIKRVSFARKGN